MDEIDILPSRILNQDHPQQVEMAGGKALSSKIPAFHLIPTVGLERLAQRFELGVERKKEKSWNAISQNQEVLLDRLFLVERLSHIIHHAMKLRDVIIQGKKIEDDDAGAIAWGGIFAICSTDAIQKQEKQ